MAKKIVILKNDFPNRTRKQMTKIQTPKVICPNCGCAVKNPVFAKTITIPGKTWYETKQYGKLNGVIVIPLYGKTVTKISTVATFTSQYKVASLAGNIYSDSNIPVASFNSPVMAPSSWATPKTFTWTWNGKVVAKELRLIPSGDIRDVKILMSGYM